LANLAPAQATTFTFGGADNGLSTITQTVDDITLTISNPSPTAVFGADSDGLCVFGSSDFCDNNTPALGISSFNLQFDKAVQLISYQVGFNNSMSNDEIITLTAGSSSSVQTLFTDEATINFTNQFTVAPNQVISVVGTFGASAILLGTLQWREITVNEVEEPVSTPEPASLVALLGFGALGLATRKKRK
jgi:hypothetical protein